jgi:transposase
MIKRERKVIRYSEAFKQQVVQEIESGKHSFASARKTYGITGGPTLNCWFKKLGKLDSIPMIIRVEKPNEKDRVKDLERQIRELKNSLAETQVRYLVAESYFEVVCEQQGLDAEQVKKKLEAKRSSKQ